MFKKKNALLKYKSPGISTVFRFCHLAKTRIISFPAYSGTTQEVNHIHQKQPYLLSLAGVFFNFSPLLVPRVSDQLISAATMLDEEITKAPYVHSFPLNLILDIG